MKAPHAEAHHQPTEPPGKLKTMARNHDKFSDRTQPNPEQSSKPTPTVRHVVQQVNTSFSPEQQRCAAPELLVAELLQLDRVRAIHSRGSASWSKAAATSGLRAPVGHHELPTVSIVDLRAALAGGHGTHIPLGDGSPLEAAPADHRMLLGRQFGARMGGCFFESMSQMRPKRQTTGTMPKATVCCVSQQLNR